jgi:hypothetical protein
MTMGGFSTLSWATLLQLRGWHSRPHRRSLHRKPLARNAPAAVHDVRQVIPSIAALDNGIYKMWFARNYRTYVGY